MSQASANNNIFGEPDESTGLLADEAGPASGNSQVSDPTPLPFAQLASLIAVHIADPIVYDQMLPYINQLLTDLHIAPPEQVGLYSGSIVRILLWLLESISAVEY